MTITRGTNGRLYNVDPTTRKAERVTCAWLVQLPGYDEDGNVTVVECGANIARLDDEGWECAAGHEHHTYGGAAWAAADTAEYLTERAEARNGATR